MEIYRKIIELIDSGGSGVLVTLVEVEGSAPRTAGTKMLVVGDRVAAGTIGGGKLEQEMLRLAAEVSASGRARLVTHAENGTAGPPYFLNLLVPATGCLSLAAGMWAAPWRVWPWIAACR